MNEHAAEYRKGSLSLPGTIAMGTGVMIGAGIFALTGQVAELAAGLFPIAFIVAAVISGFSTYSYIKVGSAYPSAGGIAMIFKKGYGETTVTGAAALLMALSMIVNESLVALTFGTYALRPRPRPDMRHEIRPGPSHRESRSDSAPGVVSQSVPPLPDGREGLAWNLLGPWGAGDIGACLSHVLGVSLETPRGPSVPGDSHASSHFNRQEVDFVPTWQNMDPWLARPSRRRNLPGTLPIQSRSGRHGVLHMRLCTTRDPLDLRGRKGTGSGFDGPIWIG